MWWLLSCSRRLAGPPELEARSAGGFLPISDTRSLSLESCLRTSPGCWDPNNEARGRDFFLLLSDSQVRRCSPRHQPTQAAPLGSKLLGGFEEETKTYSQSLLLTLPEAQERWFPLLCSEGQRAQQVHLLPQNQQILVFQSKTGQSLKRLT